MCAILDANVAHEVFEDESHEAGLQFRLWITAGRGRLVVGGKLTDELSRASGKFRQWASTAQAQGKIRREKDNIVNQRWRDLEGGGNFLSNDVHIIALAQVSGARLLYSKDKALHKDFRNKELIDRPRGKIYSTLKSGDFSEAHRSLLANRNLCGAKS